MISRIPMKKFSVALTLLFQVIVVFCFSANPRVKYNFNVGWKVQTGDTPNAQRPDFDDASWKEVTVPYAFNEEEAFKVAIHDLSAGITWFRKHFKLPKDHQGKKIFLEFEGIRQAGEFYLNGKHIGLHENGISAFGFDITDLLLPGKDNVLAVRIDNDWSYKEKSTGSPFQWNDKNFNANYGGITKNVYLHVTDKLHQTLPLYSFLGTTGVYVYASNINIPGRSATITAEAELKNEYPVAKTFQFEVVVNDMDGKTIKTFDGGNYTINAGEAKTVSAHALVNDLNFWSWGYGYLYSIVTILRVEGKVVDEVSTRTGFRKTDFSNGMVTINDRVLQMKGYAQRTSNEWPAIGNCLPAWLSDYSNGLMVASNANLVRWMHITASKQDIQSCDRMGLIQSMQAGDSEKDVDDRRWGQRVEVMRDAIIYNRNNPSIVFYESGNKGISEEHMKEMKAIRDQYDPHGGRAIGSREMLDSKIAEYGGEMLYINKSARIPFWAMEYSRDEGLRKYWDEFSPPYHKDGDGPLYRNAPALEYNRNQDSHAIENVRRWYDYWRERPGTGKRVSSGGVNIVFSDTNTHFRGAENYRRSGEVDAMRIPKDGFYAHQVMWDGWVDPETARIHIIGHWNYKEDVTKDINVISSADKVELFMNDKSLGFGEPSYRFLYTFKGVNWKTGKIKAVGYSADGKVLCKDSIITAGAPYALRLTKIISPKGLQANGADMALIEVEVIDEKGQRCPTALNKINFNVSGPVIWKGGIAQGPDNYILAKSLPVECGVNRVLVQTTTMAGKISINATSDGLKPSSLTLTSVPFKVTNGLSTTLPDEGLPSNLKRGATPSTPSYKISRIPITVARVEAPVNQEKTVNTVDDDEITVWSSGNKLSDGWIKYEFQQKATISDVVMKLSNWRSKSYPLRITVDGKEVFKGNTEKSLGYITISFPPIKGKTVLVELIGATKSADAFNNIVEVTGKKLESDKPAEELTELSIIEIEFYENVKS